MSECTMQRHTFCWIFNSSSERNQAKPFSNKKFRPPQSMKENQQLCTSSNEKSLGNCILSNSSSSGQHSRKAPRSFKDFERDDVDFLCHPEGKAFNNNQPCIRRSLSPNETRLSLWSEVKKPSNANNKVSSYQTHYGKNVFSDQIQTGTSTNSSGQEKSDLVETTSDRERFTASKRSADDVLSLFDTSDDDGADDELFSQVEIPQGNRLGRERYPPSEIGRERYLLSEEKETSSPFHRNEEKEIGSFMSDSGSEKRRFFKHQYDLSRFAFPGVTEERDLPTASESENRYFFKHQLEEAPFSSEMDDDQEVPPHCSSGMKRAVESERLGNEKMYGKRIKRSTSGYFHQSFDDNKKETMDFCTKRASIRNEKEHRVPVVSRTKSIKKFIPPTSRTIATFQGSSSKLGSEYSFPSRDQCHGNAIPKRVFRTPITYDSVGSYKHTLKTALLEHLNINLWETASKYHSALESIDITSLSESTSGADSGESDSRPSCKHGSVTLKTVRKEGKNKGRMFYSCSLQGDKRCNFFVWLDEAQRPSSSNKDTKSQGRQKPVINDNQSLMAVFESRSIQLYCGVKIARKSFKFFKRTKQTALDLRPSKKVLYIVLPKKKASSCYNKEDLWVISKSLEFQSESLFIARSVFYGPNSSCELEISPLASYSISDWDSGTICHAIQVCNASTEFSCLDNLQKHVQLMDVPVLSRILSPVTLNKCPTRSIYASKDLAVLKPHELSELLQNTVQAFSLNEDQATAIKEIAWMFAETNNSLESNNITLIHGVFGAGKSFLLSVSVLFLLQLFERIEEILGLEANTLKLMISSTTNVAVDRVLCCLLNHGYEDFIRVGSLRKIAKVILPNSLHLDESNDQELKELNAILKTELTEIEKGYVKKAIEMHKLGANRKRLNEVRVVGVTCAACSFPLLKDSVFQVHLLDECSQMIEPLSLLPIARFKCERLVLVGDPNQLSPTIQGSESEHSDGLELTLFERLQKAGLEPVVLRCQYRCHPLISAVCSKLFYKSCLKDGVSENERMPTVDWLSPISVVDIYNGSEMTSSDGSICNMKEVGYCVKFVSAILREGIEPSKIGIITQYKAQVNKLQCHLQDTGVLSSSELKGVQISTVDAFQGAEKDIIILSCVRTNFIGFINCLRRTNVALSRARHHLVVVGNLRLLQTDVLWKEVLKTMKDVGGTFGRGGCALIPDKPEKLDSENT